MVIFAWILWSMILAVWGIQLILLMCAFLAFGNGKNVKLKVDVFSELFMIATFVFLTLYLFA